MRYLIIVVVSLVILCGCDNKEDNVTANTPRETRIAQPINDHHLGNAHILSPKVISGAGPHDEHSFAAMQKLGIKTVISVDGSKPDVEAARKYGLRYVHLPMGYDSVNEVTAQTLSKAIKDLPGPIYVHCHHGKHRGPAAAAVACVMAGELTNDEAVAAMKKFGTGENYTGLWASARNAKLVDKKAMKKIKVEYREVSPVPELAEAMVKVDEHAEHLKEAQKANWLQPKDHPDIDPPHEALQLREVYVEISRTEDHKKRSEEYRKIMDASIAELEKFETALRAHKAKPGDAKQVEVLNATFNTVMQNCKSCHKVHRDVK